MTNSKFDAQPDIELIERVARHDQRALALLYEEYSATLCGVLIRLVNDEDQAADLLQDTFLRVWNRADSYDPSRGRVFLWLHSIARNLALDWLRSRSYKKGRLHVSLSDEQTLCLLDYQSSDLPPDLDLSDLVKIIDALPAPLNQLFRSVYVNGRPQQEVADSMNVPLNTVKSRLYRGKRPLRKSINLLLDHA